MGSLLGREEIRRLQKAARDNNKKKLTDWVLQFEGQLDNLIRKSYEDWYQEEITNSVNNFIIAVAYTAYFSEENKIDKDNIGEYMADLFSTIDMFRTGEYTPMEYVEELKNCGVLVDDYNYDYDGIYKKYIGNIDKSIVKSAKYNNRKVVTICGNKEYKKEIEDLQKDLTVQGYIVFTDGVYNYDDLLKDEINQLSNLHKDKILLSNIIYVVSKDGNIDDRVKQEIEFAKEHNIEIKYTEN